MTITVPGSAHDLNVARSGQKAPRVLREVDGDFTASVKVTGAFDPGEQAADPNTLPLNGAGLLLWQDGTHRQGPCSAG